MEYHGNERRKEETLSAAVALVYKVMSATAAFGATLPARWEKLELWTDKHLLRPNDKRPYEDYWRFLAILYTVYFTIMGYFVHEIYQGSRPRKPDDPEALVDTAMWVLLAREVEGAAAVPPYYANRKVVEITEMGCDEATHDKDLVTSFMAGMFSREEDGAEARSPYYSTVFEKLNETAIGELLGMEAEGAEGVTPYTIAKQVKARWTLARILGITLTARHQRRVSFSISSPTTSPVRASS